MSRLLRAGSRPISSNRVRVQPDAVHDGQPSLAVLLVLSAGEMHTYSIDYYYCSRVSQCAIVGSSCATRNKFGYQVLVGNICTCGSIPNVSLHWI